MRNNTGEQLSNIFEQVLTQANLKTTSKNNYFIHFVRWDSIGDERTKTHTDGVFYLEKDNKRILIVYVDSPVWVAEFTMDKIIYLTRIKLKYNTSWVDDIHFKVSSRTHKNLSNRYKKLKKSTNINNFQSIELKKDERLEIDKMCSTITSTSLREKITSSMIAYKKWQHQQNKS